MLVDRLWPRGLRKDATKLDDWLKDIAPSPRLRMWFSHDPERFKEFRRRYIAELKKQSAALSAIRQRAKRGPVTLLYAARDPRFNHAVVLKQVLEKSPASRAPAARKSVRRRAG